MTADREAVDLDALTLRAEALLAVADRATNLVDFPDAVEATHVVTRDAPSLVRALLAEVRRLRAPVPDLAAVGGFDLDLDVLAATWERAKRCDREAERDLVKSYGLVLSDLRRLYALSRAPAAVSVPADLAVPSPAWSDFDDDGWQRATMGKLELQVQRRIPERYGPGSGQMPRGNVVIESDAPQTNWRGRLLIAESFWNTEDECRDYCVRVATEINGAAPTPPASLAPLLARAEALLAVADKATPGPWTTNKVEHRGGEDGDGEVELEEWYLVAPGEPPRAVASCCDFSDDTDENNARAIAALRDAPALIRDLLAALAGKDGAA